MEEVEILEEEFRRYIRACRSMTDYWTQMSVAHWSPYDLPRSSANVSKDATCPYRVYAAQKAEMYREIGVCAEERFATSEVGGAWPRDDEDLNQFLLKRRPRMSVDWTVDRKAFSTM